ncbi:MAG: 6-carboxytetrahydropterin synthase QueD [Deltaproteobacteria bacterium]|nr:6-carboxytetrahydropterin synthase QueD [Deltaproteobacteria bacterium]
MGQGQWRLRVCSDFSSSHQLRHYEGKCENMHGHNFSVEVDVVGDRLDPKLGLLMDFKELKRLLKIVTEELDHKHLNDLPAFADQNPSSELLAQYVFRRMRDLLTGHPVRLTQVMVSEKDSSRAYYFEDQD